MITLRNVLPTPNFTIVMKVAQEFLQRAKAQQNVFCPSYEEQYILDMSSNEKKQILHNPVESN